MKKLPLLLLGGLLLSSGCSIDNLPPLAGTGNTPPGSVISSTPKPTSQAPACLRTLQCILDSTANNGLRNKTQKVIDNLFEIGEPEYTQVCTTESAELVDEAPECKAAG